MPNLKFSLHDRFVLSVVPALFVLSRLQTPKEGVFSKWGLGEIVVRMGGCVSKSNKRIQTSRRKYRRSGKRRVRISTSIPEFVHLGFKKGAPATTTSTTTCKRSEVSNMTFHLTQLQWNHSQVDSNGRKKLQTFFFFFFLLSDFSHSFGEKVHFSKWNSNLSRDVPRRSVVRLR